MPVGLVFLLPGFVNKFLILLQNITGRQFIEQLPAFMV
jgi:hypothetical protein